MTSRRQRSSIAFLLAVLTAGCYEATFHEYVPKDGSQGAQSDTVADASSTYGTDTIGSLGAADAPGGSSMGGGLGATTTGTGGATTPVGTGGMGGTTTPVVGGGTGGSTASLSCQVGFRNCDGEPSHGCNVSILDDGKNCGRCGHDCLGGQCKEGQCQAKLLLSGQSNPIKIAVDAEAVYWINGGVAASDGAVMRLDHGATTAITLASGQAKPSAIAVKDSVFWTNSGEGTVRQVSKSGGSSLPLARDMSNPSSICVGAEWVVWGTDSGLYERSLISDTVNKLSDEQVVTVGCQAQSILFGGGNWLWTIPYVGGKVSQLNYASYGVVTLATTSDSYCWAEDFYTPRCGTPAGSNWGVNTGADALAMALDETGLYWLSDFEFALWKTDLVSGDAKKLASTPSGAAVAVWQSGVYWTESATGRIMMIAKP